MQSTPAYTTVSARQSFQQPMTVIPTPPPQPSPKPNRWPDSVRQYVQRCFALGNSIDGVEKQEMEIRLKQIITQAAETNTLEVVDWSRHPLPQEIIQAERNQRLATPLSTASAQMSNLNVQDTNLLSKTTPSKKRKSNEYATISATDMSTASSIPPWRTNTNQQPSFHSEKRARLASPPKNKSKAALDKENRRRRFESKEKPINPYVTNTEEALNPHKGPVIGKSQTLLKSYLRLTAPPNPETVRPLPILEQTLELLKKKWRSDNDYNFICDQFKSLRQDLTVQHIKNEFTVTVYEIHARIALEKGDLGEYNQCQTQLRALYAQDLGGHPLEFKAYRILYFLYTCNRTDMNDALADLTQAEKSAPAIKHALEARSSLALGNYHRFFKLYLETPNMGAYLMDMFVFRERIAALASMTKAFRSFVKLRFVTDELGFESDEEAARFICENGGQAYLEEMDNEVRLVTLLVGERLAEVKVQAAQVFEEARKVAFKKIDLKGQI